MASIVQSARALGAGASVTPSLTNAPTPGNELVAVALWRGQATVPDGWTVQVGGTGGALSALVCTRTVVAGDPKGWTFTGSGGGVVMLAETSGLGIAGATAGGQ